MKFWKYCNIPVKSSYKQYNRETNLDEAWCINDITIHCKNFSLKRFPFPLFTTFPFWYPSPFYWIFCIPSLIAHFQEVLSLPFTEEKWKWQGHVKHYIERSNVAPRHKWLEHQTPKPMVLNFQTSHILKITHNLYKVTTYGAISDCQWFQLEISFSKVMLARHVNNVITEMSLYTCIQVINNTFKIPHSLYV